MTLEMLQNEMIAALKAHNHFRKTVISGIIARVKKTAIDNGCRDNISEEMVNQELLKSKKMVQEELDTCPKTHAMYDNYRGEMEIILEFCPSINTDEVEIRNIIKDCGFEVNKQNQGLIMKAIKASYAGKIDMKIVSQVFKDMI